MPTPSDAYGPTSPAGAAEPSEAVGALEHRPPPIEPIRLAVLRRSLKQRLFGRDDPPTEVGRYLVRELLGEGGMGQVYLAWDPHLRRELALKILKRAPDHDDDRALQRMRREAKALARLSHPNVVPILDVGLHGRLPFVVMEYVPGVTLDRWTKTNGPRVRQRNERLLDFAIQAAHGLQAAHRMGLVHRDIKPSNLLIGRDGRLRIVDFGLARPIEPSTVPPGGVPHPALADDPSPSLTRSGTAPGTFPYMAPEQLAGRATPASDQFSWAVTFFEALYGRRPFDHPHMGLRMQMIAAGSLPLLPSDREVPGWVRPLLERCLAFEPGRRFASMAEVAERLASPSSHRTAILGSMVLATLIGLPLAALAGPAEVSGADDCDDRAAAGIGWAARREAVTPPATTRALWTSIDEAMLGYERTWSSARLDLCQRVARSEVSTEDAETELGCLERARRVATGLFDGGSDPAAAELRAIATGIASLPAIDACRAASGPGEPRYDHTVQQWLAQAEGAQLANDLDRVHRLHRRAHQRARDLGDAVATARAALDHGLFLAELGHERKAEAWLEEAHFEATASGDHHTAAYAAIGLVQLAGDRPDLDRAARWREHAKAAIEHLGDDRTKLAAYLQSAWSGALVVAGRFDEAVTACEDAIALVRADPRLGPFELQGVWQTYGQALLYVERFDEARPAFETALRLAEQLYGPQHPGLAPHWFHLALVAQETGDVAAAVAAYERVLDLLTRSEAVDDPMHAIVRDGLASLALRLGAPDRALAHSDAALEFCEAHPEDSILASDVANTRALVLAALGRTDEARTLAERSIATRQADVGTDHPQTAGALLTLAEVAMAAGDLRLADQSLQRARGPLGGDESPAIAGNRRLEIALAELRWRAGELDLAARHIDNALLELGDRASPEASAAHRLAGRIHGRRGDVDRAVEHLQRAAELTTADGYEPALRREIAAELATARARRPG